MGKNPGYCCWLCLLLSVSALDDGQREKCGLCCALLAVKYLREVTPYFRKTSSSLLSDVGWTDDVKPSTSSSSERAVPLRLCYVCRGDGSARSTVVDGGSGQSSPTVQSSLTTLELHSPDRRSSCLLRCVDEDSATQWLIAISNVVASLTTRAIADVNAKLSATSNGASSPNNNNVPVSLGGDVKHLGWLAEQVTTLAVLFTTG